MSKSKKIYLDYQSSTPISEKAWKAMKQVSKQNFGNPHSFDHVFGWEAAEIVENASKEVAGFVGGLEDEIIFVSGATEANNLAILGVGLTACKKGCRRKKIIVSEIEHKSVLGAAKFLEENFGYIIAKAKVNNDGIVSIEHFKTLIDDETLIASVMSVNNEIGTYQPTHEIGNICKSTGTIFHVDAAQALYKRIDVVEEGIDLLSLSGHKIYGPMGIGALYVNQHIAFEPSPLFQGGGQQKGYRSGTVPTDLAVGFAAAITELKELRKTESERLIELRDYFWKKLKATIRNIQLNGTLENRHPGNINITLQGVDARALIGSLQPHIAISTGSACTSGMPEPSHVLRAIGLSTHAAECSVRISLGRQTTLREIDLAVVKIAAATDAYKSAFPSDLEIIL